MGKARNPEYAVIHRAGLECSPQRIIRVNIPGLVLQGRPLHPRRVRGAAGADGVRPHHRGDRAQRPRVQRAAEQCHRPVKGEL